MAKLPTQETLIAATGNAFKSSRLDQMLRNFSASYKLYWLKGVFDEAIEEHRFVSFERLAARMVASAWYPVTYFRLNLGATDILASTVLCAHQKCGLTDDAKTSDIIVATLESNDPELRSKMRSLYSYVPYRLIRPFYADRFNQAQENVGRIADAMVNRLVIEFNRDDAQGAPYRFSEDGNGIEIDSEWASYFQENRHVVQGWLDSKLVAYLQARNPSVPAIPLKIYAPSTRNLADARKYWEEALGDHVFTDIYSGMPFNDAGFLAHGPMSVDHFIPWSFVMHDEPWNLAPMFRDANSSKGNKLPGIDEHLHLFCEQQFDAALTLRNTGRHKKIFESYSQIDAEIMQYERSKVALQSFTDSVTRIIVPLHQIAANQGFQTWKPTVEYATVRL